MHLFPNPSNASHLTIELLNAELGPYELIIYDFLGKIHKLHKGIISDNNTYRLQLDISELAESTYLIKIIHSKGSISSSFIKN